MTMIEKVARAIRPKEWGVYDALGDFAGAQNRESRRASLDEALAALSALLEPSEGMVSVATMFDIENGRGGWVNMTESEFYEFNGQLIRAALDEKEGAVIKETHPDNRISSDYL